MIGFSDDFKPGEEYIYNYSPELTNEKLFISYGFYYEGNNLSKTAFRSGLSKQWLNKEKFEMIRKIIPNDQETIQGYNDYNRL